MHDRSSRYAFSSSKDFVEAYGPEASAFFRSLGLSNLMAEMWTPLTKQARTMSVLALDERPWPPKGVGAKRVRGLVQAALGADGQAILTPPFLHPTHAGDVGLGAGLLKYLLDDLVEAKVPRVTLRNVSMTLRHPGALI